MADTQDLDLLTSGETDLVHCDFSNAVLPGFDLRDRNLAKINLKGADLSGADLRGSILTGVEWHRANLSQANCENVAFDGAIHAVRFSGANLRNAKFSGLIVECDFSDADISGADFSASQFREGNDFTRAISNTSTEFHGSKMPRALSRDPVFSGYRFHRGELVREGSDLMVFEEAPREEARDGGRAENDQARIINKLRENPTTIAGLATSLRVAIHDALTNQSIPNEPEQLARHQAYIDILKEIDSKLEIIAEALADYATDENANRQNFVSAATTVAALRQELSNWFRTNAGNVVDYGSRVGLLGVGTMFLAACGAAPTLAFPTAVALLNGEKFARMVMGKFSDE